MTPLHLHQALPEWVAACLGWLCFLPAVFFPQLLRERASWVYACVWSTAFVLMVLASYGGSRCYIHYAFSFSVLCLPGCLLLACWLKRMSVWLGAMVLAGGVAFVVGLPHAVQHFKPGNGNAEMRAASRSIAELVACEGEASLVVLDAELALHLHRLSRTSPQLLHFVPSMVPGGYDQHRRELADCILRRLPRYVIGSARNAGEDAALLSTMPTAYRAKGHAELGLPTYPAGASRPEFVLYIREN